MQDCIKKLLEESPCDMDGTANTPATNHLFNMNDNTRKLIKEKAQLSHHLVPKLLYLCRMTRHEIQTAVALYVLE